jgi:Ca2+-binding RTX toxin-like protein
VSFGGGSYGWQTAFNLPGADDLILGVPTVNHIIGSSANDAIVSFNGGDVLTGGDGNDVFFVNSGSPTIVEQLNEGTDEVRTALSYTLPANVENLTLLETPHGPSDTQTFNNMALGPIINGDHGWEVLAGGRDQSIVDLDATHGQVFKMSSDPAVADFAGPYSPALGAVAGEPDTGAPYNSQVIDFQFKAVSEPDTGGNFSGDGTDPAPNDWRQLVSGVDPT